MVRHLSLILTLVVWMLSTLPCCLVDHCICQESTCACSGTDDGGQTLPCDCCSPFIHCNTCTGCTVPACLHVDLRAETPDEGKVPLSHEDEYCSRYASSIWQPPKAQTFL